MATDPRQDAMMLDYLMRMGELDPQKQQIARQRALVDQLRQGGGKTPQSRSSGGIAVAAHPLEFLSSLAHQGVGAYKEGQADKQQATLQADQAKAMMEMRRKVEEMQRMQQMAQAQQPGVTPAIPDPMAYP